MVGNNGLNKSAQSITIIEVNSFTEFNIDENFFILITLYNYVNSTKLIGRIFSELIELIKK